MKLTTILMLFALLQVSARGLGQITLHQKNIPLENVLRNIEHQTDYVFFYKGKLKNININVNLNNVSIEAALDACFKNLPLTYKVVMKTVVISTLDELRMQEQTNNSTIDPYKLTGTIVDSAGRPLPGAKIQVKGSKRATSSDIQGRYTIDVEADEVLVISYIGFTTQEINVANRKELHVKLSEVKTALGEVVVIGYGTTTKKDLTGSVGQVKMPDLAKAPVFTFTEALAGRVAGVQVATNDGQPGSAQNIVIRGSGSLTQSTAPLYVIDGFAMEDFQSNSLNPEDIESITVLKDASGTAIYGARGSNGVVVIQTKKGKAGKPVITLNTSIGIQELRKQMEMMSPYEFVKTQTEMINSSLVAQTYFINGKTLDSYKDVKGTNWQDLIFRQGTMETYNVSLRGGTEQTKYSVSGVMNDQAALMINSGYKRQLGRLSLDQTISDKMKVGINANYSNASNTGLTASSNNGTSAITNYIFANVYGYRPIAATIQNLEDELFDPAVNVDVSNVRINPVITAQNTYRKAINSELVANAYFTYNFSKDLTLNIRGGNRKRVIRNEAFYNSKTPQGAASAINTKGVNGSISFSENNTWTNENTLSYQKVFKEDHKFTLLGGLSFEGVNTDNYGTAAQLLPNEQLGLLGLDEGTPLSINASGGQSSLMSYFSRIDYNYKSKYLVSFTARADGSSKFKKGNKWGYFPSAAIAWNMAEENFLKSSKIVSSSKLRLSYGVSGNNRIGYYDIYNRIGFDNRANGVSFGDAIPGTSAWLSELGNSELKWEITELSNIGYDLGLFKNRIELTAEIYRKKTKDLLLDAKIPYSTGYSNTTKNIGSIKNEGLELSLNTVNIQTPSFKWESNFNISFNKSNILALTESNIFFSTVPGTFTPAGNLWAAKVGSPISMFHGFVFDGVYQFEDFDNPTPGTYLLKLNVPTNGNTRASIRPGDIKYKDLNADGIVNDFDQTFIGRPEPLHTGGFSNNFMYKGFSLNVFFQWSYGNDIFNGNRLIYEGNAQYAYHTNQFASWVDRWSPENPTNKNFRVGGQGPTGRGSSRVVEDGSYLRLKTVSLAYQIPAGLIKKFYLKNLSLHASAQNLITWTKYSGLDPEVSVRNSALTRGFDYSAYPQAQTIVVGLNATF